MKGELDAAQIAKKARDSLSDPDVVDRLRKNTAGSFCLIYEPVFADYEHDTPETIEQIDRNNVVFEEICT